MRESRESRSVTIGSETQEYENVALLTGIQRVLRETHLGLTDQLGLRGIRIVPMHTREGQRVYSNRGHAYLAGDPVTENRVHQPHQVDAMLLMDLNLKTDFRVLRNETRSRSVPVFAIIYDLIPLQVKGLWGATDVLAFRLYLQQTLLLADHVVVISDKVAQDIRSLGWYVRGEIHVIHLGSVFPQRAPTPKPDDRLSIIYVSSVAPYKGHDLLLSSFDHLRRLNVDVDLTLVGHSRASSSSITSTIQGHPDFGGRLKWHDSPSDHHLRSLIGECTVGAFPSSSEGYGLFLEEGLSLGLKMVVNDLPVFRERDQDNVFFSSPDESSFTNALLTAHSTPWHQPRSPVRSMQNFVDEFADLILANLEHKVT